MPKALDWHSTAEYSNHRIYYVPCMVVLRSINIGFHQIQHSFSVQLGELDVLSCSLLYW